jgi:hypothetical protein
MDPSSNMLKNCPHVACLQQILISSLHNNSFLASRIVVHLPFCLCCVMYLQDVYSLFLLCSTPALSSLFLLMCKMCTDNYEKIVTVLDFS